MFMLVAPLLASLALSLDIQQTTPPPADALDETLALVGMKRVDLGWAPKGWWPRFPDVPYKLRAFDALFAEPLDTVPFTRGLAQTAWDKLDPAKLDEKGGNLDGNLFQAVQRLGIDPRFGGFRGHWDRSDRAGG